MQTIDRRSQPERRKDERYTLAIEIEWSVDGLSNRGRLTDLSARGCFILTGGQYSDGETVSIYFPLTDGTTTKFRGEIKNHVPEIGFAVSFIDLTELQKQFIHSFAELYQSELENK